MAWILSRNHIPRRRQQELGKRKMSMSSQEKDMRRNMSTGKKKLYTELHRFSRVYTYVHG